MTEQFTPELGQYAFTNTPWHSVSTPHYITAGFQVIAAAIQEVRGIDPETDYPLTSNGDAEPWEGEIFQMRRYCWCDGEAPGHEDGCPPNFHYEPTGFEATWYKHASRGESCSSPVPSVREWGQMIARCIAEVGAGDHRDGSRSKIGGERREPSGVELNAAEPDAQTRQAVAVERIATALEARDSHRGGAE